MRIMRQATGTRTFTVDTVPPELSIDNPSEPQMYINSAAFTLGHTNVQLHQ